MGAGNTRTSSDHHQDQTLIDGCRITCFFQPRPGKAPAGCFIGVTVMLPFSQWPEMPAVGRVVLIAASVLSAGSGFLLLFWAADAVRDRS